jgi:predicted DNA-binding transcriptional regulator AlpA
MAQAIQTIPQTGFLRIYQIVGDRKRGILPIIPISRASWWRGVANGKYPRPIKLSEQVVVWKAEDIRALIERLSGQGG